MCGDIERWLAVVMQQRWGGELRLSRKAYRRQASEQLLEKQQDKKPFKGPARKEQISSRIFLKSGSTQCGYGQLVSRQQMRLGVIKPGGPVKAR